MAKMDEELKAMRTCVTALDSLDGDNAVERQARVAAYVFDRFVPEGMNSRAIRQAIDQLRVAHTKDVKRRDNVERVVDGFAAVQNDGAPDGYDKNGVTRQLNGKTISEQWWSCRECKGESPHREWLPSIIEVKHEDSCQTGTPGELITV